MATTARKSSLIAENRRAYHEYHILETYEVGLSLTGTEVKSLRMGRATLGDSFARIDKGEVWLHHMHVSPYTHGNRYNPDPMRPRKLLMKRSEISRLIGKTKEQGLTLIPLKLYWKGDWAKMELGLAKGKQLYDKREALASKSIKREVERALKERSR